MDAGSELFEDYSPSRHTTLKHRRFNLELTLFQGCAIWVEPREIYIKMKQNEAEVNRKYE